MSSSSGYDFVAALEAEVEAIENGDYVPREDTPPAHEGHEPREDQDDTAHETPEQALARYATRINKAAKAYLHKKHSTLVVPPNLRCPITLELFMQPVVASDGVTYELHAITAWLRGKTFPVQGTGRGQITDGHLVANHNLRSEVVDFRELHKLAPMPAYQPVPTGSRASAPASTRASAPASRSVWAPQHSLVSISRDLSGSNRMSTITLMSKDGWLNEIQKEGLMVILRTLNMLPGANSNMPKHVLIMKIVNDWPSTNAESTEGVSVLQVARRAATVAEILKNVERLLCDEPFLNYISCAGLELVLKSYGLISSGSSKTAKIASCLLHAPRVVTIEPYGFQMVVTRSTSMQQFYAEIAERTLRLRTAVGLLVPLETTSLNDIHVVNDMVFNAAPTPETEIFILDLQGNTRVLKVDLNYTVKDVKRMLCAARAVPFFDRENLRLLFAGKQLEEDDSTLSDYDITANSTLHMVMRLRGGAKKGVKKVMKAEKLAMLKAQSMYKSSRLNAPAAAILQPLTTNAEELHTRINAMSLEQLKALSDDLDQLPRSNDVAITEVLAPHIVPEVKQLQKEIEKYKQNITTCEEQLEAVLSSVSVAFAENYYKDAQYDYSSFYGYVENRITELKQQKQQEERDEMLRLLQAAPQAAPQAALQDVAMTG